MEITSYGYEFKCSRSDIAGLFNDRKADMCISLAFINIKTNNITDKEGVWCCGIVLGIFSCIGIRSNKLVVNLYVCITYACM